MEKYERINRWTYLLTNELTLFLYNPNKGQGLMPELPLDQLDYLSWLFLQLAMTFKSTTIPF